VIVKVMVMVMVMVKVMVMVMVMVMSPRKTIEDPHSKRTYKHSKR
jgi:hypothetical protein